ncbi:hypothetical protein BC567DRAFT_91786 [Phyllosticta citribraziliensis]
MGKGPRACTCVEHDNTAPSRYIARGDDCVIDDCFVTVSRQPTAAGLTIAHRRFGEAEVVHCRKKSSRPHPAGRQNASAHSRRECRQSRSHRHGRVAGGACREQIRRPAECLVAKPRAPAATVIHHRHSTLRSRPSHFHPFHSHPPSSTTSSPSSLYF